MSETTPTPPQRTSQSGLKYTVAAPMSYSVLDPFAPELQFDVKLEGERFFARSEKPSKPETREVPAGRQAPEKRAVWIVHGMGQQIPFETVDGLAEGIMRVGTPSTADGRWEPRFRAVKVGDQTLQRVELDVRNPITKNEYELHLYEVYWAPKTEGVATLADVVSFFWDGGTRGLLNCMKKFKRALMGGVFEFKIGVRNPIYIAIVMLVLAGLALLNAVILAASAAKIGTNPNSSGMLAPLAANFVPITAVASIISAAAITFGCLLFLAEVSKPRHIHPWYRRFLQIVSWTGVAITSFAVVAGGGLLGGAVLPGSFSLNQGFVRLLPSKWDATPLQGMASFLILCSILLVGCALTIRASLRSDRESPSERSLRRGFLFVLLLGVFVLHIAAVVYPALLAFDVHYSWLAQPQYLKPYTSWLRNPVWVWPFLIFLSAQIRTLLVEYAGDVAIYVTSNKVDRFDDVRSKIKDIALKSASAVYLARQNGGDDFEYGHIAVVGHSLGSVIAYDALNHLMNDDLLSGNKIHVVQRTKLFESLGSPLDKTTFFFTIQGKDTFQIREQLAAVVQPLIQNEYEFRKFPWINVYSRNDIISGHLDYFDYPRDAALTQDQRLIRAQWHVRNYQDKDAAIALVAHVDYWKNTTAWKLLYDHIAP